VSLERLAELTRAEQEAVEGRRWEALLEIQAEQLALLRSLRGRLGADALPVLERSLARVRATERVLFGSLAERHGVIERLRARRRAIGGYHADPRRAGRFEIRA